MIWRRGGGGKEGVGGGGKEERASCMSLSLGEVVLVLKTRLDLLPAPSQCFQPNYSGVNKIHQCKMRCTR